MEKFGSNLFRKISIHLQKFSINCIKCYLFMFRLNSLERFFFNNYCAVFSTAESAVHLDTWTSKNQLSKRNFLLYFNNISKKNRFSYEKFKRTHSLLHIRYMSFRVSHMAFVCTNVLVELDKHRVVISHACDCSIAL